MIYYQHYLLNKFNKFLDGYLLNFFNKYNLIGGEPCEYNSKIDEKGNPARYS
jgi:hypothetical protein